jgi:hypothetical protein
MEKAVKIKYLFLFEVINKNFRFIYKILVVRVPGYRSRVPGSIPGTTRFSEK